MNRQMADFLALEAAKEPFHHIHGAGKDGYPVLLKLLQEKGVDLADHPALQVREYIYDMAAVMRAADLVLCRAGASTISELTALGVPALIVPSPMSPTTTRKKTRGSWKTPAVPRCCWRRTAPVRRCSRRPAASFMTGRAGPPWSGPCPPWESGTPQSEFIKPCWKSASNHETPPAIGWTVEPFWIRRGTDMSQLLSVRGGRRLEGEVTIQGAKNSVLPILAATLLARGQVALLGCPRLRDVDASIRILRHLGCDAHWEADALAVDTTALRRCEISDVLMREMRSSAIFLGAILARCGQADLSYPGGCELGPRPIDLHLAGLRDLGAEIREEGGFLHCRADRLRGREVVLRMPSVGATENLMLAACGAEGVTVISNAAREPEVVDLQNFLNACGLGCPGRGAPPCP